MLLLISHNIIKGFLEGNGGSYMKNTLIFIGLAVLSVLYLLEVDYSALSWLNAVAFVIIALTLIPLLWRFLSFVIQKNRERKQKRLEEEQDEAEQEE